MRIDRLVSGMAPGIIGVYSPAGSEFDVGPAAATAQARGWRLAYPRVAGEGELTFHLSAAGDLEAGYRGILEPPVGAPEVVVESMSVVLVPGVGFDRLGHRLGQGGGFYDRLLSRDDRPEAWGMAYAAQILPKLPTDPWDHPVDRVITERGHAVDGSWVLL